MRIKIFKGKVSPNQDNHSVESQVDNFVSSKKVIDIKQSLSPYGTDGGCLLVITVLYE